MSWKQAFKIEIGPVVGMKVKRTWYKAKESFINEIGTVTNIYPTEFRVKYDDDCDDLNGTSGTGRLYPKSVFEKFFKVVPNKQAFKIEEPSNINDPKVGMKIKYIAPVYSPFLNKIGTITEVTDSNNVYKSNIITIKLDDNSCSGKWLKEDFINMFEVYTSKISFKIEQPEKEPKVGDTIILVDIDKLGKVIAVDKTPYAFFGEILVNITQEQKKNFSNGTIKVLPNNEKDCWYIPFKLWKDYMVIKDYKLSFKVEGPKFCGEYSTLRYIIYEIVDEGRFKEVYEAGNSPFASEIHVKADEGVGLETMKKWCEQTGKMIAKENNGIFLFAEKSDEIEDEE